MIGLFKGHNEKFALFFILLFSISLRLIPTLGDGGQAFVAFRDPIYNLSLSETLMKGGRWIPDPRTPASPILDMLFTPALNLCSMMISQVLGLDLFTLCRFLPSIVFTVPTILLLFKTFNRLVGSNNAMLAIFIFAVCYKYNTFTSLYVQESLGTVFFAMALYALVAMKRGGGFSTRTYSLIFIIAAASLGWTHFFSAFVFLISITIALLISRTKSLFSRRFAINTTDFMVFTTTFLAWVAFIATFFISVCINYGRYFLNELPTMIQQPSEVIMIQSSTGIMLSPLESAVAYAGILIPISFGALGFFDLFLSKRRSSSYAINWLKVFGIISLLIGVATIISLRGLLAKDMAYRFLPFFYMFISPICAIGVNTIRTRLEYSEIKMHRITIPRFSFNYRILAIILTMIIPILSTGLLIPSFLGGSVTLSDRDIVSTSKWLSSYGDKSATVIGEASIAEPIAVYSNISYWTESKVASLCNTTTTNAVYYGDNISALVDFLRGYENHILIINKHFIDRNQYLLRDYTQSRIPSANSLNSALDTINRLPFLNKVYDGESTSIYLNMEK